VTDEGLGQLTALPVLQRLGLGNTRVTDAGVEQLKNFATLRYVDLHLTQVTDSGLNELTAVRPEVIVNVGK